MAKRWIKQGEISRILAAYSAEDVTFEKADERYCYMARGGLGYWIQFIEELCPDTAEPTGRILVQHKSRSRDRSGIYRNRVKYTDVWERNGDGTPVFLFRNLTDAPPSVYEENERLKEEMSLLQTLHVPKERGRHKDWVRYARELEVKLQEYLALVDHWSAKYRAVMEPRDGMFLASDAHQNLVEELELCRLNEETLRSSARRADAETEKLRERCRELAEENERLREELKEQFHGRKSGQ